MASAAIARAAAVGPTAAAPQAHANSSLLSAKALALVTKRVLARRAPACADKTRDSGDGDGGDNDWDNAAGKRAPGAHGNEVKGQGVQLAASAQQHLQCLHDSNGKSCSSGVCVQGSATYNDMLQRFDELLLLELDSPTIVKEYGSAVEESIDELLDAFDSLELKLNSYAAQLSLVGLTLADESAPGEKQSARQHSGCQWSASRRSAWCTTSMMTSGSPRSMRMRQSWNRPWQTGPSRSSSSPRRVLKQPCAATSPASA